METGLRAVKPASALEGLTRLLGLNPTMEGGAEHMSRNNKNQMCSHGFSEVSLCEKVYGRDIALLGPAPRQEATGVKHDQVLTNVNHVVLPRRDSANLSVGVFFGSMAVDSRDFFTKESEIVSSLAVSVELVFCPRREEDFVGERLVEARGTHDMSFGRVVPFEVSDQERTMTRYAILGGYPTTGSLAILSILDHEPRRIHIEGFSWYSTLNTYEKDISHRQRISRFANTGHKVDRELLALRKILASDARISFDSPTRSALERKRGKHAIHYVQDLFLAIRSITMKAFGPFAKN